VSMVKIHLRSGSREIEIEATRSDVDALLEAWWRSAPSNEGTASEHDSGEAEAERKTKRTPKKRPQSQNPNGSGQSGPLPHQFANEIKQHADFDTYSKKIINAPRDPKNKVFFVLWFTDRPLTSGDVYRILEALDVKVGLPKVSTIFKDNSGSFITDGKRQAGGPPVTYRLTAAAKTAFENWLHNNNE